MADSIKHTLKRCDEIRDKYLTSKVVNNPFDIELEPHLIEIRTDDVVNEKIEGDSTADKLTDLQRYDIIKFLETQTGEVIKETPVLFNLPRKDADMFLESVLKPKTVRQSHDHEHNNILTKRYKAVESR